MVYFKFRHTAGLVFIIIINLCFFSYSYSNETDYKDKGLGPLNIANNFPTSILFSNYTPESTETLKEGKYALRFGITESNTIIFDEGVKSEALIDIELTRINLNILRGITKKFELGFEIPFFYYHGGFMDIPIEWIEDRIGKTSKTRKKFPRHAKRIFLRSNGTVIYDFDDSITGFGDSVLKFKFELTEEERILPDISIKFDLSLPTGNERKALGTGDLTFTPALLLHKSYKKFHFQLHFAYFIVNDINLKSKNLTIETLNYFNNTLAIEYALKDISWIFQFSASSNPFKKFNIEDINSDGQVIAIGFKKPLNKEWILQGALSENISSVTYPDFAIDFALEYRF